jgi:hypothetical protein
VSDFRIYGITASDVRGGVGRGLETWRLPAEAVKIMRSLLVRTGFDPDKPIQVSVSTDPNKFVFTQ